ncbi:MAG: formyltransferase family protein [Pseudomonadales bacterium]
MTPDLILSVRYGGILDADHVELAHHGILNLHSGALPAYRGVLASFRAISAGEDRLTATLHRIVDRGIDTHGGCPKRPGKG